MTLFHVMDDLKKYVPEIENNEVMVMARIKQHIHNEKFMYWYLLKLFFVDKFPKYFLVPYKSIFSKIMFKLGYVPIKHIDSYFNMLNEYVNLKLQTHNPENWGRLDQNIEWVKEYGISKPKEEQQC